jgi:hypothetical protein
MAVWFETSRKRLLTSSVREDWQTSDLPTTLHTLRLLGMNGVGSVLSWLVGREDRPTVLIRSPTFFLGRLTSTLYNLQFSSYI